MAFTKLKTSQNEFLEDYLRGTDRTLSTAQAEATYGIKNLRARMTDFRHNGLKVRRDVNTVGRTTYKVSARDESGSRAHVFTR